MLKVMSSRARAAATPRPTPEEEREGRGARLEFLARVTAKRLLVLLPIAWTVFFLVGSALHDTLAYDFRHAYLSGAEAVLRGDSPYAALDDPVLTNQTAYVYPPLLAYALTPLTFLSVDAAAVVATFAALALLVGTLLVLGVRDWRCYAAAFLWAPATNALHMASVSLVLAFAVALAWKCRSTVWPLATTLGLAVATKLFVWPLLVWALATRRLRAVGGAVVVAAVATLVTWGALGFAGLAQYPSLLRRLAELEAEHSYSILGMLTSVGVGSWVARGVAMAVGIGALAACVVFGRSGDDRRAYICAIVGALALTPILWQHYLVLLLVPLALTRPRFSAIWLVPVLLWFSPRTGHGEGLQPLLPGLIVGTVVVLVLLEGHRYRPRREAIA